MKIRSFFAGLIMAMAALVGCEQVEQLGMPDVTLGATDIEFTKDAGSLDLRFTATREWRVEYDADWIAVTPESGQGSNNEQTLTVTVTENTKGNRSAKVTVTIGMVEKAFTVSQEGPDGETGGVEALTVKEFIDKADTENYYRLSGTVSGFNATYCSFDITDETGKIYVYSVTAESKAEWTDKIKNGGTVVLQGKYEFYEKKSQHEVVDAIIESFTEGSQGGPEEPVNAIYFNDFDKETSAKVNDKWPYCDEFDGWKNEKGSGVANVTYSFKSASPRATSGNNNIWLPKGGAYLAVQDIALGEAASLELSFNVICGSPGNYKKEFSSSAFKVWLSADKAKWVELPLSVTANGTEFDDAVAAFSVPASTSALSIVFEKIADDVDGYRIDNVNLSSTASAGTAIDFTQGVSKDFGTGSVDGGGDNTGNADGKPASLTKVTVAEFKTKEVSETDWYELTGKITEIQKEDWGNFVIEDETGSVLIYGMTSKWVGSNDKSFSQLGLKVGDTVTLGTLRGEYNGTPQGGGSKIPAYYISHVAGEGGDDAGDSGDDNTGEAGEYDPQGITWTLGEKAYDKTSGNNAQTGTVNGVAVNDMLKLGTGSLTGDAVLHIPAGTKKVGFYLIAWKGKTATVKASVDGKEVASITPKANAGATGNPPYTITVTSDDYYEIEVNASEAIDVKVETTDKANGRVIFIGLKAITE
ncbi:MAG: BACON domain-containing protein [Bacteroidales bacterium]|nr:BACON domain-containing protein [Bacteroidales bacterium]